MLPCGRRPQSCVIISAPEYVIITSINEHQLLDLSSSLEQNFTLFLSIFFLSYFPSASLSVFTDIGAATVPKGPKFYCVFAISEQTIRFSKLPIKLTAVTQTVLIIFLCISSEKKHIVHSESDRET